MNDQIQQKIKDLDAGLVRKWQHLVDILSQYDRAIVAFSGGVDSGFLSAVTYYVLDSKMLAVTIQSPVEVPGQLETAQALARQVGFPHLILQHNDLEYEAFVSNPADRCYHCKRLRFSTVKDYAEKAGIRYLLEGSNADDVNDYRPGRRAVDELGALSPLMQAQLTKAEIRTLSQALGLLIWNHPSTPCLATRVPYGTRITSDMLAKIGSGEVYLKQLGFETVRVRYAGNAVRLEIPASMMVQLLEKRQEVIQFFKNLGFTYVTLDLAGFRSGSMNEVLKK